MPTTLLLLPRIFRPSYGPDWSLSAEARNLSLRSIVGGEKICQCLYRLDYNTAYVLYIPRPLKYKGNVSFGIQYRVLAN